MLGHFYSVPDGWLLCNGAAVSRSTYAALFAVIGTKHGSGDGSTTFNLPNLANRFVEGTTSIGSAGTFKSAGLPNISGNGGALIYYQDGDGGFIYRGDLADNSRTGATGNMVYWLRYNASRASSTYGSSSTVQPPAMALLPCIKI